MKSDSEYSYTFDFKEILIRALKYLLEGFVVCLAVFLMPGGAKMPTNEVFLLGVIAAVTFSILDLFAPSIGISMRQGAGFGMGANMVGFPTR
jgi:hypothetical protein